MEKYKESTSSRSSRIVDALSEYSAMLDDNFHSDGLSSMHEMESELMTKATRGSSMMQQPKGKRIPTQSWCVEQSDGRFVTMEDF